MDLKKVMLQVETVALNYFMYLIRMNTSQILNRNIIFMKDGVYESQRILELLQALLL